MCVLLGLISCHVNMVNKAHTSRCVCLCECVCARVSVCVGVCVGVCVSISVSVPCVFVVLA